MIWFLRLWRAFGTRVRKDTRWSAFFFLIFVSRVRAVQGKTQFRCSMVHAREKLFGVPSDWFTYTTRDSTGLFTFRGFVSRFKLPGTKNWRERANFICGSKRTNHIRRIPRQSLGKTIAEKTDQSGARFYIKFSWQIKYLLIWVPF